MAETQPWMLQALCYTADEFRQNLADEVCGEGVVDVYGGDLIVASTAAADHSITVAAGSAYILNNESTGEAQMYRVLNDAAVTLQLTAGGGGNDRIDTIIGTVSDNEYPAGTDTWVLSVLAGTPSASAVSPITDAAITASAAAVPDNSIVLAYVFVDQTDTLTTTIVAGSLLDARNNYFKCGSAPWVGLQATAVTSLANAVYTQVDTTTLIHRDRDFFTVASATPGPTITVLQSGIYDLNAGCGITVAGGTSRAARIIVNNTNLPNAAPNGTTVAIGLESGVAGFFSPTRLQLALAANDTIKLAMFQDSGGAANTYHASDFITSLTIRKVG